MQHGAQDWLEAFWQTGGISTTNVSLIPQQLNVFEMIFEEEVFAVVLPLGLRVRVEI